ncbi:urease accessory protein UreD [Mycobacterium sp. CBMA271]|uniref:urease accessory protein UreD n=1 Tax=unclassified Mycobacteroides TaxID=2618759 RepID=UPI0012DC0B3E|nr:MULTISPECIES: urease accessory protein UreD [unclassified Mycobacteroides]MUM17663.1 urease accessory protein UreD [Mycobacteroides sp. CBMA 326]MUM23062.1 urease accessory protein UreD [Mycobacteroides sp. CBMA 271]
MRTDVEIIAEKGRLPRLRCSGSLQARLTATDTVHLVGVAANPLGGDEISVRIDVGEGAALRVRSVAAAVALPGRTTVRSSMTWNCTVQGDLDLDPALTIVAANASHHSHVTVHAQASATLRLRERVQIGRTGEAGKFSGFWSGQLDADIDDRPLLRHCIELGAGSVTDDELGSPLALISELRYPTMHLVDQQPADATVLHLAGDATLLTWQGRRLPAEQHRIAPQI